MFQLRMPPAISAFAVSLAVAGSALADDWITRPSTYTHDAEGCRVTQFQPIAGPVAATVPNFRTSGFTHTRSTLNYGQSADNYHRVEKWGDPVRPYGEWRFPYRPFSTPYPNWGAPYAGLNFGNFGFGYGYPPGRGGRQPHPPGDGNGPGTDTPDGGGQPNGILPRSRFDPINPNGIFRESPPQFRPSDPNLFRPYPSGPGTPYPVAPYYDGYYPTYRD